MESAKIFGSDEDCRSCESGWTMYLDSPSHDQEDECYYDDEDSDDGGDSMDSDASSGPMEATSCLKLPQVIEQEQINSIKKKKTNYEEMVLVETRIHNNNIDDDGGDNHDYDDGNDSYSAVRSYVGSVRQEGYSDEGDDD